MAKVLVVDDDESLLQLLSITLRSDDFRVSEACDGEQALRVLAAEPPDVIVLDLEMPRIGGREFYSLARRQGYEGPVIICSAHGARQAQLELGADDWIDKPFDPEMLLDSVSRLVEQS